jgi:hypothetical protein
MFDSCALLKHLEREPSHCLTRVLWKTVWSVKLAIMFDTFSVLKHLEREDSHFV